MITDRTLLQAVVFVKAYCRATQQTPLIVSLVEGTSAEEDAWRKEAEKYLRARREGVKYKPDVRDLNEEIFHD